jgi:hypothetical protein
MFDIQSTVFPGSRVEFITDPLSFRLQMVAVDFIPFFRTMQFHLLKGEYGKKDISLSMAITQILTGPSGKRRNKFQKSKMIQSNNGYKKSSLLFSRERHKIQFPCARTLFSSLVIADWERPKSCIST